MTVVSEEEIRGRDHHEQVEPRNHRLDPDCPTAPGIKVSITDQKHVRQGRDEECSKAFGVDGVVFI